MNIFRSFFSDSQGKIVISQAPNAPLITWFVASIAQRISALESLHDVLKVISVTALLLWAYLEIQRGVSPFRRVLGIAVAAFTIHGLR